MSMSTYIIVINLKGGMDMYILSIVAVAVVIFVISLFTGMGIEGVFYNINLMSFSLLALLTVPMLVASHLAKDFNNAFGLCMKKNVPQNMGEIKRAIEAVDLMMKVVLSAGSLLTVSAFIVILKTVESLDALGPKVSVALLSLIYALGLNLILLPVRSKLRIRLQEFMEEE